jgi:hypothetical protein
MARKLTAEDLIAGGSVTHTVSFTERQLGTGPSDAVAGEVELRPLTLRDVQRVHKAAKDQRALTSVLMVQQALVSPPMTVEAVSGLSAGVVQLLLRKVNEISGLSLDEDDLDAAVKAPMARACFVLAREFGWTPAECAELTVGQVLLYLEMIARHEQPEAT